MAIFVRDRSFYKKVLTIGGPIAAQQVITVGVNMMDNIMLGRLNETALAASSAGLQVHNLFHFMTMGMSMGASVLLARFFGSRDEISLRKTLVLMYRLCLCMVALFTAAVGFFPEWVISLLSPDAAVIVEGASYLRWTLPCFLLYGLSMSTTIVLRNLRMMHIPLYSAIGAFFVNIFFNWVFIFGKLGAPAMGVAGAGLGTLISRIFEFSVICGYFFLKEKKIRFRLKDLFMRCGDLLPEYVRIGPPVFISDTLLGIGTSATMSVAGYISQTFLSAVSVTSVVQSVTSVFTTGLGQSAVIITGNTLGEGNADKAQQQGVTFAYLGFLIGTFCGIILVALSPLILSFYNISPETYDTALWLMRAMGIAVIFHAEGSILTKGVLRGGGDTRFLMIADLLFLWVVSVPLTALAGLVWHWHPFWIFLCMKAEHILKSIWCLFRLHSRKWMKKIRAAHEA